MENSLYTVILVDDEKLIRKGLRYLIDWESNGFKIIAEAENGKEAIELINSLNPDLIFTDIVMPKMSGIELMKYINFHQLSTKSVVLSSHDDFEYVKQALQIGAVDYFLKDKLDEKNLLSVLNVIKKNINPKNYYPTQTENHKEIISHIHGFSTFDKNHLKLFKDSFFKLILFKLGSFEMLTYLKLQLVSSFNHDIIIISDDYPIITMLVNYSDSNEDLLLKDIEHYFSYISETSQIFIVHSNKICDFQNVRPCFIELLKLSEHSFYHDKSTIISIDRIRSSEELTEFDRVFYQNLINQNKFFHALDYFNVYIYETIENSHLLPSELKAFTNNIIYNFLSNLNNLGMKSENLNSLKLEFLYQISNADSVTEFINNFNQIMSDLSIIIQTYFNKQETYLVQKIDEFITLNYSNQITLEDLSKYLSFSYYYTSNLFNQIYSKSFNDHLNDLRIEESKRLLINSDTSLSDIYQMVGFSNHSYFSSIFKARVGMTPSNYRKTRN